MKPVHEIHHELWAEPEEFIQMQDQVISPNEIQPKEIVIEDSSSPPHSQTNIEDSDDEDPYGNRKHLSFINSSEAV